MTLSGTVVNGVIVLQGGAQLPEEALVRVELEDPDDLAPPPEPYDREKELAILRESLADVSASSARRLPSPPRSGRKPQDFCSNEPKLPPAASNRGSLSWPIRSVWKHSALPTAPWRPLHASVRASC